MDVKKIRLLVAATQSIEFYSFLLKFVKYHITTQQKCGRENYF